MKLDARSSECKNKNAWLNSEYLYIRNSASSYETWLLFFSFLSASASFFRLSTNLSACYKPQLPWTSSAALLRPWLERTKRGVLWRGHQALELYIREAQQPEWIEIIRKSECILKVNLAEVVCGNSCDIPIVTYRLVQPEGRIKDWQNTDTIYQRHKAVLLCLKRNEQF